MDGDQAVHLVRYTLITAMEIAGPLLCMAMAVGLLISIFQTVTQINEMTLTFVPKILVFATALTILFPWFLKMVVKFTNSILMTQWANVVSLSNYAQ